MEVSRVTEYISPGAWALVEPLFSPHAKSLLPKLITFIEDDCLPAEDLFHAQIPTDLARRWKTVPSVLDDLKRKAKRLGLWNLWLQPGDFGPGVQGGGLSNVEYAVMAEIMGHSLLLAPQATNCSAPDTGNMEVLARFGTSKQKERFLKPLLNGDIRSSFSMTEFGTASSDATNLHNTTALADASGSTLKLNGHKWWISGAGDPRNHLHIVLAVTHPDNPPHRRHTLLLVDPTAPGVNIVRPMQVMGYDDAPEGHCEVIYSNVSVAQDMIVGGKDGLCRGFEMIQARLGPGRLHHCMRSLGVAERALSLMLQRVSDPKRKTFGRQLKEHGTIVADIAKARGEIDSARMLVLTAARRIDQHGAKAALKEIGIAKFTVPPIALRVVDTAMQAFGAEGISQDTPLAYSYAQLRTLRYADGPDEVHIQQVGKHELKRVDMLRSKTQKIEEKRDALLKSAGIKAKL